MVCYRCVCLGVKHSAAGVFVLIPTVSLSLPCRLMCRGWQWSVRLIDSLAAGLRVLIASDAMTPDSSLWPPTGSSTLHCSHARWGLAYHTHTELWSKTALRHSKQQGSGWLFGERKAKGGNDSETMWKGFSKRYYSTELAISIWALNFIALL